MAAYGNWSPTAWVYLGLHGSYGLIWLLKELVFPDPSWDRRVTFGGALVMWVTVLGPYWFAPWWIVSQGVDAPNWLLGVAILVYAVGVVTMVGADAQKFFTLKVQRGLIATGFFARSRHPNYLGEMMLYGSFAALTLHWAPWLILLWVWTGIFLPNMVGKEKSMSRYPEWAAYEHRTWMLVPRPW